MIRLTGKSQKVDLTGAMRADLLGNDQESSSDDSDDDGVAAGAGAFENGLGETIMVSFSRHSYIAKPYLYDERTDSSSSEDPPTSDNSSLRTPPMDNDRVPYESS